MRVCMAAVLTLVVCREVCGLGKGKELSGRAHGQVEGGIIRRRKCRGVPKHVGPWVSNAAPLLNGFGCLVVVVVFG